MGFKEELKVYLSTVSADTLDDILSSAEWVLRTPVTTPNANYRIKYQVSNALFPGTYPKVSEGRGNSALTIAWGLGRDFDVQTALDIDNYVRVNIHQPITNMDWPTLQNVVNARLKSIFTEEDTDYERLRYKPQFFYDEDNYRTFSMRVTDWSLADQTVEDGDVLQQEPGGGWVDTEFHFKILTQADNTSLPDSDLRLANVIGFPRSYRVPAVSLRLPEEIADLGVPGGIVRAPRSPDLMGTRFITMRTNLKTSALDPLSLSESNVMCVVPVTSGETDTSGIYYLGNVQQPAFVTLANQSLDRISIDLHDDHGNRLGMHADWFVELTILFEEEEKTDVYRGTSDFTMPVVGRNVYDPIGYTTLQEELSKRKMEIDEDEYSERLRNQSARRR